MIEDKHFYAMKFLQNTLAMMLLVGIISYIIFEYVFIYEPLMWISVAIIGASSYPSALIFIYLTQYEKAE